MTHTTTLETKMLDAIAHHEMSPVNGASPETIGETGTFCWADDFAATIGIKTEAAKGVLGSLVKKQLIVITEYERGETVVDFTEKGFDIWKQQ